MASFGNGTESDDDVLIIDDDSDENSNSNETYETSDSKTSAFDWSDQSTSCRNPLHDKWGSNSADFRWPSQVPTKIQYIFRLLGYERAPGSRCKFCVLCVEKAGSLKEEEIRELEKQASLKMSRRQYENMHVQQQLEKLDKLNISEEEKALQAKQLRMLAFVNPGKFMEDFDPERSTREMKKMNRRIYKEKNSRKNQIYSEQGLLISNNADLCDCLEPYCPGCHFPCPKCGSEKCGADCRNNRRWVYELIDIEGTGKTVTFPAT